MMTYLGKLLAVPVFLGFLGGCNSVMPIMDTEAAKDPKISTDPKKTDSMPKASPFPDSMK